MTTQKGIETRLNALIGLKAAIESGKDISITDLSCDLNSPACFIPTAERMGLIERKGSKPVKWLLGRMPDYVDAKRCLEHEREAKKARRMNEHKESPIDTIIETLARIESRQIEIENAMKRFI